MMQISDIAACAEIAHEGGALLTVDNTFPTPFLQRPLDLGADIVVHSTTKYLNGHSDVIGGAIVTGERELGERIRDQQRISGPVPGPLDCWLVLRGIKTLHVRMTRHCENAERVAEFLVGHPAARHVIYPGLPTHPQHELARRQMQGFGGMISFDAGSFERARTVAASTRIFQLAESLGGVESLISVPAEMTHASVPEEVREKIGLTNGLVRLSVGIESVDDLIADLGSALDQA
jgi:cystathionine beta-lyase/cystathionine gamma-synthase